jgi:integrase
MVKRSRRNRVRYLEHRELADGSYAYYYNPPKDAREAKVADRCALGKNYSKAIQIAEELNERIDAWREAKRHGFSGSYLNPDSVKGLFVEFQSSRHFRRLAPKTQRSYMQCMDEILEARLPNGSMFGDHRFRDVTPQVVDRLYDIFRRGKDGRDRLAFANAMMRVARRIWGLAQRSHNLPGNPFSKPGLESTESRDVVWTRDDVDRLCQTAIEDGYPSLATAVMLALELGQRVGDVRAMTWDHYHDGVVDGSVFRIKQSKTKEVVHIPVSDQLIGLLETLPRVPGKPIVICESTGKPYDEFLLRNVFARIRERAGISADLQMRDLRRTALTEMSEAGASTNEIMSVSGHRTRAIVDVYARKSQTQAANAIRKRDEWRRMTQAAEEEKRRARTVEKGAAGGRGRTGRAPGGVRGARARSAQDS